MFGVSIGWALLRKLWPFIAIAALAGVIWVQHKDVKLANLRAATANAALEQAVAVNDRNREVIRRFDADREEERKLTAAAIAAEHARTAELNEIKKELRNAPGANDTVAPYFDAVGDRLRGSHPEVSH